MHLQEYDEDGLPQVSTEVPVEETDVSSYSMRPIWFILAIVIVVGIYLVRRNSQQREMKEFEA
jgi:hypothetical protein